MLDSSGDAGAAPWRGAAEPRASPLGALVAALEAEQERWFLWLPVMLGGGIAAYFHLPTEPTLAAVALVAAAAAVLHVFGRRAGLASLATGALLAAAVGATLAKLRTESVRAPVLERRIGPVEVQGYVELVEPRPSRGQRITLRVIAIATLAPEATPYRVRVRTRDGDPALAPGQAVAARVVLAGPAAPSFPGDFDFGRLAWYGRLGGVGLAFGSLRPLPAADPPPLGLRVSARIELMRQDISRRITAALPGETGAIATALITGERGAIPDWVNQAYRDSGLFHILSISGLHMVIMAGAVFFILRLVLAAVPAIALRYPVKKWAAAGAILGAFCYLLISGAAFATVRSAIMITIMFLAVILDRPALALRNVALAALVILVPYPESLFDAGFQMSFAAVVALISAYEFMRLRRIRRGREEQGTGALARLRRFGGEIILSTIIASLAVAPFGIYHFHNTQQLSLIANLIAIPVCNLLVMPAALAVLVAMPFGLEAGPLWLMGWGIEAMTATARAVAALPGAVTRVPAIPTTAFALIVAGGLWLLLWQRPWRLIGLLAIIMGLLVAPTQPQPFMLVGREGTTIAVRDADGRLSAIARQGSMFELGRWLEADGDARTPDQAASGAAFSCDTLGCTATAAGHRIAVAFNPAALRDDCATSRVLILRFPTGRACAGTSRGAGAVIIDPVALARRGAHAFFAMPDGGIRIETVAASRGARPWSMRTADGQVRPRAAGEDAPAVEDRTGGFGNEGRRFRDPPPEIDEDSLRGSRPLPRPPGSLTPRLRRSWPRRPRQASAPIRVRPCSPCRRR